MDYIDKLKTSAEQAKSIVCMGLDPLPEKMPDISRPSPRFHIEGFFELLFDEMRRTGIVPGAFKLNEGFYTIHDSPRENQRFQGSVAMANVMNMLESKFPDTPVILDSRISSGITPDESNNYAFYSFESWKPDAVTFIPCAGADSLEAFCSYYAGKEKGKGVYVLSWFPEYMRGKNSSIDELCSFRPAADFIVRNVAAWAQKIPNIGLFIDADIREIIALAANDYQGNNLPLLVDGDGNEDKPFKAAESLKELGFDLSLARINLSTRLIHPWMYSGEKPSKNWLEICIEELRKANEKIGYK